MPVLNQTGVRNINVWADSNMMLKAMSQGVGEEFQRQKPYGISLIEQKGVFHPKIMLLTGKQHGLLVIGSGNLTTSGFSANEEIWGAFHISGTETTHAPIFGEVWRYLNQFSHQIHGVNRTKLDWISTYSPWLEQLPSNDEFIRLEGKKDVDFRFLGSGSPDSILSTFINILPKQTPVQVTVIAPFFDQEGSVVKEIHERLNPKKIRLLVDTKLGTFPINLQATQGMEWFDWYLGDEMVHQSKEPPRRLHAKLVHVMYEDGLEFLLFGSPNATRQAMGSLETPGVNAEAALLIRRHGGGNYIKELGLEDHLSRPISLWPSSLPSLHPPEKAPKSNFKVKILYAGYERNGIRIVCSNNSELARGSWILYSDQEEEVGSYVFEGKDREFFFATELNAYAIGFRDSAGTEIANRMLIHQPNVLKVSNPSEQAEKLAAILQAEHRDDQWVHDLMEVIGDVWELKDKPVIRSKSISLSSRADNQESKADAVVLDEEEFNQVKPLHKGNHEDQQIDTNVTLADYISSLGKHLFQEEESLGDNEEELLLQMNDRDQGLDDNELNQSKIATKESEQKLRDSSARFFNRMSKSFQARIPGVIAKLNRNPGQSDPQPIPHSDLASFQIVVLLMIQLLRKRVEGGKEAFFDTGHLTDRRNTRKGLISSVIGQFCLLVTAGFFNPKDEEEQNMFSRRRDEVAIQMLLIMVQEHWRTSEEKALIASMVADVLHFVASDRGASISRDRLLREAQSKGIESEQDPVFIHNLDWVFDSLFPSYQVWKEKWEDQQAKESLFIQVSSLAPGPLIFKGSGGFLVLFPKDLDCLEDHMITLGKPGFLKFSDSGLALNVRQVGEKVVKGINF